MAVIRNVAVAGVSKENGLLLRGNNLRANLYRLLATLDHMF